MKKREKLLEPFMLELYSWLSPGEKSSMSSAAAHLKKELGEERYKTVMKSVGFSHLVQAVRLFDDAFEVDKKGYYLKRI